MYKYFLSAFAACCLLAGCSGGSKKTLSKAAINARIDSTVAAKMMVIDSQASEDLDSRMSIEVKAKADSIIAARKLADTLHY